MRLSIPLSACMNTALHSDDSLKRTSPPQENHDDTDFDILPLAFAAIQRQADQNTWWTHQGWVRTECDDGPRAASWKGGSQATTQQTTARPVDPPSLGKREGIWHGDAGQCAGEHRPNARTRQQRSCLARAHGLSTIISQST